MHQWMVRPVSARIVGARSLGNGVSNGGMSTRRVIIVAFVVTVTVLVGWSFYANVVAPHGGMGKAGVVPSSLAGLEVTELESGASALAEVEKLHGGAVDSDMREAWVAHYGQGGLITVWASRSADSAAAESLSTKMTERVSQGESPFKMKGKVEEAGLSVHALDGMGQSHYYFTVGAYLYWLAAPAPSARSALVELVGSARNGAGLN